MNTDTLVLFLFFFFEYVLLMITWTKNVNNFEIAKVQHQGVAQHLLNFLPISACRCL